MIFTANSLLLMSMLNEIVRAKLHSMIEWYIGTHNGYDISVGEVNI